MSIHHQKMEEKILESNDSFNESFREEEEQISQDRSIIRMKEDTDEENLIKTNEEIGNKSRISEVSKDEIQIYEKKEKKKMAQPRTTDRQSVLDYERESGDYETYGIAFDLEHCRITEADSSTMKRLKRALREYLQVKEMVVAREKEKKVQTQTKTRSAAKPDLIYHVQKNIIEREGGYLFDKKTRGFINPEDIGTVQRDQLGQKYDALWEAIGYYDGGITLFKHGRGRKRMDQVKRVRELMEADNRKYWLSQERRFLKTYGGDDMAVVAARRWPTYSGMVRNMDLISERMQRYKDRKRKGERVRFWHGWGRNIRDTGAAVLHGIFGSVEMAAALPLMLAGNAIKLTGKVAKIPLQLMSGIFNKCCKWAGSKARWRMDSFRDTWKKGWVNYNDGRKAYRNILSMGVAYPILIAGELVFLEVLQGRRLFMKNASSFAITKDLLEIYRNNLGIHLNHIKKGLGINGKYYKDRNMLTPEEGGDASNYEEYYDGYTESDLAYE